MKKGVCFSCKAPIFWVTMVPSNRKMPVNTVPSPEGNVSIDWNVWEGIVLTKESLSFFQGPLYISHFATCPYAQAHRSN